MSSVVGVGLQLVVIALAPTPVGPAVVATVCIKRLVIAQTASNGIGVVARNLFKMTIGLVKKSDAATMAVSAFKGVRSPGFSSETHNYGFEDMFSSLPGPSWL